MIMNLYSMYYMFIREFLRFVYIKYGEILSN